MANLLLKRIKDWATSITSFRTGDVIPVDGPNGTAKMPASDLQDAILGGPIDEAVQQWLEEHPEATTTVGDGSLTEAKFSDALKLQTIKDYVTPEMFGAVGDGVTDDTEAFELMVSSGNVYVLSGNYAISGVTIDKQFVMLGSPSCNIRALSSSQPYLINITRGYNINIDGVNFNGGGSSDPNARGNVSAILFNGSSNYKCRVSNCTFWYCRAGISAIKNFWHSKIEMCIMNGCMYGIIIGDMDAPTSGTYLELMFEHIYTNQCNTHIYLTHGSNFKFLQCSFGSEQLLSGSIFIIIASIIQNISFESCNFERIYLASGTSAITLNSQVGITFINCYLHGVDPAENVPSTDAYLFHLQMSGSNLLTFEKCRFAKINIAYMFYVPYGTQQHVSFDWGSATSAGASISSKIDAKNVYSSNAHVFKITNERITDAVPDSVPWNSHLNIYFRGSMARVNKSSDRYVWNGSAWIKLIAVPQPASDENTYTLKNVAGTLTWVQDT